MLTISRPPYDAGPTFLACISKVKDPVYRARLDAAVASIEAMSEEFDSAALGGNVHEILPHNLVAPDITVAEMSKVYKDRMVAKKSPARQIYDEIYASTPHGLCPLCAQRHVATLDHYLPKAHYPGLAVAPLNLVPACSDCNKAKLDAIPTSAEEVGLHPYYDDLGPETWLRARVVEDYPTAIKFRLSPPDGWDAVLTARVRHHFRSLGLTALYASLAAEELVSIRHQMSAIHAGGGAGRVHQELDARALSCAADRPNSWRTATYRAWADSDWFCGGGFAGI